MLDNGSHNGSGAFWSKSQATIAFVGEGVHFFFNDVSALTNALFKKFGMFKNGGSDFLVVIEIKKVAGCGFY